MAIYLCSKLDDHYSVSTAALPGLNKLLTNYQPTTIRDENNKTDQINGHILSSISVERSVEIIRTIMREIHVQSMVQADRYLVFSMCKFVLMSRAIVDEIKAQNYGTDFVFGFIQSMDGEKDPRNLLVCFECIKLICEQLSLGPFVEEMFEVFACYFPIDFTPVYILLENTLPKINLSRFIF